MKKVVSIVLFCAAITSQAAYAQPGLSEHSINGKTVQGKYFYGRVNVAAYIGDMPAYQVDSVQLFYRRTGDSLIYWTLSGSTPRDNKAVKAARKDKDFGTLVQQGMALTDGRVTLHELRPTYFLIRNDSLFQEGEIYDLSVSELATLTRRYEEAENEEERLRWSKKIDQGTHRAFVPIFSPRFFDNGIQPHEVKDSQTKCKNTVRLANYWVVNSLRYYSFEISNNCGYSGHRWGFTVSENFDFVRFGGYGSKESSLLTRENSNIHVLAK